MFFYLSSQDDNRYNASKGAHINLKRAERARTTVNKLPCTFQCPLCAISFFMIVYSVVFAMFCNFIFHDCVLCSHCNAVSRCGT